ncbi:MAG: hypothetical protein KF781_08920 [Chitinophagaceae bacterium]|nr:hypothetical protein [Chitinophagaceae bacterium]MCW5905063.1 hypothetical protein [Chitinophagaceae bacterium]
MEISEWLSIAIIAYVLAIQLLRIVYLLFRPKFLNERRFGIPQTKIMMLAYYVLATYFLTAAILLKFDIRIIP